MGDIEGLEKIREEAIGSLDATRKIQWFLDELNDMMNHKGLIPGTITTDRLILGVNRCY